MNIIKYNILKIIINNNYVIIINIIQAVNFINIFLCIYINKFISMCPYIHFLLLIYININLYIYNSIYINYDLLYLINIK